MGHVRGDAGKAARRSPEGPGRPRQGRIGPALVEGRKLFEQGKYDAAEKLAYKASSLHGPYGVWDFGDKPEKLLADIQTAREKARKIKVPPAAGTTVAKQGNVKPTAGGATTRNVKQASAPAPSWPSEVKTADVKGPDLGPGVTTAAVTAVHRPCRRR